MSDDERRRLDRDGARKRRANRRKKREAAFLATLTTGGVVVESVAIVTTSSLLDRHFRRTARYLDLLEFDPAVSVAEKCRIFCGAIGALAKGTEAIEFRERLESVEERIRHWRAHE